MPSFRSGVEAAHIQADEGPLCAVPNDAMMNGAQRSLQPLGCCRERHARLGANHRGVIVMTHARPALRSARPGPPGQCSRRLAAGLCLAGLMCASAGCGAGEPAAAPAVLAAPPLSIPDPWDSKVLNPGAGCSTVYATDGRQMLTGNSEDSLEPLPKVWFVPDTEDTFGLVLSGYANCRAQGGVNDQGLFFDLLTVSRELPIPLEGKEL